MTIVRRRQSPSWRRPTCHSLTSPCQPLCKIGCLAVLCFGYFCRIAWINTDHQLALQNSAFWGQLGVSLSAGDANGASSSIRTTLQAKHAEKGAVVFLAPQRNEGSMWGLDRFCMLLRAVRSVDQHLNTKFGPYPIFIVVAKDFDKDPKGKDATYTEQDRALIRRWAPKSTVQFVEVEMYSGDALEPGTTREQIFLWRQGNDGGVGGRDLGYTSMCRLWSGRLQSMSFLNPYEYYIRMDDDSLLLEDVPFDPFQRMQQKNLTYAYRRKAVDRWGIGKLWEVSKPYLNTREKLPFTIDGYYYGEQPYNNFHVSRVDFWRAPQWQRIWNDYDDHHLFYKYRVGDANVHAIAIMTMPYYAYETWSAFPYAHNSNDLPSWGKQEWIDECKVAYKEFLI